MNDKSDDARVGEQTIEDFGEQWTAFSDVSGYFGSKELLADFIHPFGLSSFKGRRVVDIGAGTGRHVDALLQAGAQQVIAVEPSKSIEVIKRRFAGEPVGRVILMQIRGDQLPPSGDIDCIVSIGVMHHIPDPAPVVKAAFHALRPGGHFVIWLYGHEGNALYLAFLTPIRWFSKSMPMKALQLFARILDVPLSAYILLCKKLNWSRLPLHDYMSSILGRLPPEKRRVVIYDQLNPHYAKYYTRAEAIDLMSQAPFEVDVHHRRGYSWVVIGRKPLD